MIFRLPLLNESGKLNIFLSDKISTASAQVETSTHSTIQTVSGRIPCNTKLFCISNFSINPVLIRGGGRSHSQDYLHHPISRHKQKYLLWTRARAPLHTKPWWLYLTPANCRHSQPDNSLSGYSSSWWLRVKRSHPVVAEARQFWEKSGPGLGVRFPAESPT